MISLLLLVLAFFLFLIAAIFGPTFQQSELDLVAFGLASWVLSILLSGFGPASPIRKGE